MMYLSETYGPMGIYSKVVADSTANGVRLTTLELRYPRFIHSEFMTHRMFSRNASSSRAIPIKRMIEDVTVNPAQPTNWGLNKPGMQAGEEADDKLKGYAKETWLNSSKCAVVKADTMEKLGLHKQIVNRILEPYQFITVVCTATEWDNFFHLRLDPAAQPEIQHLAACMRESMEKSKPSVLGNEQWHHPYVNEGMDKEIALACSVARCARVSYLNHDNSKPSVEKDLDLFNMLSRMEHLSPFEHQATPLNCSTMHAEWPRGMTHMTKDRTYWSGNFRGWVQFRQWRNS